MKILVDFIYKYIQNNDQFILLYILTNILININDFNI